MPFDISNKPASLGAEVRGVTSVSGLDAEGRRALKDAFLDRHVLNIRGVDLSPAEFLSLARLFGVPQVQLLSDDHLDGYPEISVISNYNRIGGGQPHVRATYWHTDDSYFAVPAMATMLYARALPTAGGDTAFIDCHAVLEAMPEDLRRRVDGRRAVHKYQSRRAQAKVMQRSDDEKAKTPDVAHPIIRTHPETGRKSLYINPNRIDHVEDMGDAESDALLDDLYAFAFQDRFQFRHQWRMGDVLIWDNRCTMHRATTEFDVSERREFLRILLKGTVPE